MNKFDMAVNYLKKNPEPLSLYKNHNIFFLQLTDNEWSNLLSFAKDELKLIRQVIIEKPKAVFPELPKYTSEPKPEVQAIISQEELDLLLNADTDEDKTKKESADLEDLESILDRLIGKKNKILTQPEVDELLQRVKK